MEEKNYGFKVNTDFEDISSTSQPVRRYDDIVSDSSKNIPSGARVNLNAFADDYSDDDIYYRKKISLRYKLLK